MCSRSFRTGRQGAAVHLLMTIPVEELYSLPQKPPSTMHTFAAWLEDWVTKLVAADEISAYVEPRRAMAVLSHVGKPLQAQDTLFMTEWVAIFRESGLRDDVSVENLREACLQLVVCARARARELQVDVQVERASRAVVAANTVTHAKGRSTPAMESAVCKFFLTAEGCKFGDECKYKHPRTNGKCLRCGAEGHSLSTCTRPSKTKSGSQTKQSNKGKGRSSQTPTSKKPSSDAKAKAQPTKDGAKGKGKGKKDKSSTKSSTKPSTTPSNKSSAKSSTKTSAKSGEVSFDNDDAEEEAPDASMTGGMRRRSRLKRSSKSRLTEMLITHLLLHIILMLVKYMIWRMLPYNRCNLWFLADYSWKQHQRSSGLLMMMRLTRLV